MLATALFWIFAAVLIGSAALVVSARNPVHSVLFLILGFFNAAGLFLLTGAEFLAMILIVVYVGAVAVLFLFVVMMLDVQFTPLREGVQRYAPVGATVGVILLLEIVLGLGAHPAGAPLGAVLAAPVPANTANTTALGLLLYTRYALLFQLAGLVLLVAMIGAIVLTLRDKPQSRKQRIARQVGREVADTLRLVDVRPGQGVAELGIFRPEPADAPPPDLLAYPVPEPLPPVPEPR